MPRKAEGTELPQYQYIWVLPPQSSTQAAHAVITSPHPRSELLVAVTIPHEQTSISHKNLSSFAGRQKDTPPKLKYLTLTTLWWAKQNCNYWRRRCRKLIIPRWSSCPVAFPFRSAIQLFLEQHSLIFCVLLKTASLVLSGTRHHS